MAELEVKLYQLGDLGTNCYIVSNKETKEAIVVDPADNADFIYRSLTDAGLACVGIFLTHGHYDHIGALDDLRKLTGVKAYASEDEKQVLESRTGNLSAVFGHPLETSADIYLQDGQEVAVLGTVVRCISVPGPYDRWHVLLFRRRTSAVYRRYIICIVSWQIGFSNRK